jgi:hypothetical protein
MQTSVGSGTDASRSSQTRPLSSRQGDTNMKAQPIPPLDVRQFKPRRSNRTVQRIQANSLLREIEMFLATCSNEEVAEFYAFYENLKTKYHPRYAQQRLPEFLVRRRVRRDTTRLLEAVTTLGCRLQFSPNRAGGQIHAQTHAQNNPPQASQSHGFEHLF